MKKRIAYIDLLKVIAIFMVITLHNGTWHTDFMKTGNWSNALQFSVRLFCEPVPIFMLINGFLMFGKKLDSKKHIRRIVNTVLLILCWSVIMDVFFTLAEGNTLSFTGVIKSVLNTYISNSHTGVLWFLQKLVTVYLVFPVLKHLFDTNIKLFNYLLLVLVASTYAVNLVSLFSPLISSDLYASFLFFLKQYSVVFTTNIYLIYFMLGGFLLHHVDRLNHKCCIGFGLLSAVMVTVLGITISVSQGATCGANLNYSQIFLFFTIIGLFLLCSHIPLNNSVINKCLACIGDNTMGIYLLHRMVIWSVHKWIPISTPSLLLRLGLSCIVLLISLGITIIIRKIPKVSFLIKL